MRDCQPKRCRELDAPVAAATSRQSGQNEATPRTGSRARTYQTLDWYEANQQYDAARKRRDD